MDFPKNGISEEGSFKESIFGSFQNYMNIESNLAIPFP